MHFVLVYRGDKATADEYIKVQDDYLNANPVSEYNPGSDTEAENNESWACIRHSSFIGQKYSILFTLFGVCPIFVTKLLKYIR